MDCLVSQYSYLPRRFSAGFSDNQSRKLAEPRARCCTSTAHSTCRRGTVVGRGTHLHPGSSYQCLAKSRAREHDCNLWLRTRRGNVSCMSNADEPKPRGSRCAASFGTTASTKNE